MIDQNLLMEQVSKTQVGIHDRNLAVNRFFPESSVIYTIRGERQVPRGKNILTIQASS